MKYLSFFLLLTVSFSVKAQGDTQYIQDYLTKWANSEKYLLDVINAMPDDKMDYIPTESAKSFRDISTHIVSNMLWLSTDYLGASGFESEYKNRDISKEELVQLVKSACAYARTAIEEYPVSDLYETKEFFTGPMNTMQILRLMNDHMTHHRGQLALYLRMNDIAVPRYVGW